MLLSIRLSVSHSIPLFASGGHPVGDVRIGQRIVHQLQRGVQRHGVCSPVEVGERPGHVTRQRLPLSVGGNEHDDELLPHIRSRTQQVELRRQHIAFAQRQDAP